VTGTAFTQNQNIYPFHLPNRKKLTVNKYSKGNQPQNNPDKNDKMMLMHPSILSDLNPQQKAAVTYNLGPLLVLAGAGSGKTKVLTHRVAYFISKGLVNAENVLLTTFTNKAAGEMRGRIIKLINQAPGFAGTFHSFCAKILRIDGKVIGIPRGFLIYDEQDQKQLIKEILEDFNLSTDAYHPAAVLSVISDAKNQMLSPNQYAEFAHGDFGETVFKVYGF